MRGEWAEEDVKEGRRWGDVGEEEAEGREACGEDTEAKFDQGPEEKFGDGDCVRRRREISLRWRYDFNRAYGLGREVGMQLIGLLVGAVGEKGKDNRGRI